MFQPFPISWENTERFPLDLKQTNHLSQSYKSYSHSAMCSYSIVVHSQNLLRPVPSWDSCLLSHRKNFLIEIQCNPNIKIFAFWWLYCAWDLAACLEFHTFLLIHQHKLLWNSHFLPANSLPCSLFSYCPPLTWCPCIALTPSWSPVSNNNSTFPSFRR